MTPTIKRYTPLTGHSSLTLSPAAVPAPVVAPRGAFSRPRVATAPPSPVARAQARVRSRTASARQPSESIVRAATQTEAPARPALRTEQIHNEIIALRADFDARFAVLLDELQQIRGALSMDVPVETTTQTPIVSTSVPVASESVEKASGSSPTDAIDPA